MKIKGLQKLTLLDFPGKMGCTVFLGGCNFRCPFCHNSQLLLEPASAQIEQEEFFAFLKKREGLLDGVCVSGGEPLLSSGVEEFIARIKGMGYSVKLDTNGSYPEKLKALVRDGLLDYVAMDIKNSPEKYALTAGLETVDMARIFESADFLMSGEVDFEFRTTVVKQLHSQRDFERIGEWLAGDEKFFLQQFVDSDFVLEKGFSALSRGQLCEMAEILRKTIPRTQLRGV